MVKLSLKDCNFLLPWRSQSTSIARLEDEISQKMIENSVDVHWKATGTLSRRKSRPAPQPPASKPETSLKNVVEDLSIRDPSQLVDGIAKSVATHWRHQAKDLVQPGVFYEAQVCCVIAR
jgi:hypothetical protein